jgi:hypothetical protein
MNGPFCDIHLYDVLLQCFLSVSVPQLFIIIIIIICHYGRFGGDDSSSKCAFALLFVLFYILSTVVYF